MKIGQKLKDKRTASGLSQEALSQQIGVSRQTISSWENDRSYPDIGSILKLSDLYGVSLDELLKEDENMRKYVEKTSAFHERLWTYLFVLTILLIPLAMVLERCLMAVTAGRVLTAAAMVIMPFLLNAKHQIMGEDKAINFVLVVVWIAIGISGAYFLVFGWILIYHTMLNKKGVSFWLAVVLYFAVPIGIAIGQRLPQLLDEGLFYNQDQMFGRTYYVSEVEWGDPADVPTMVELSEAHELILDGEVIGQMTMLEVAEGSSTRSQWEVATAQERYTLTEKTGIIALEWGTAEMYLYLEPVEPLIFELTTDISNQSHQMAWYGTRAIPENAGFLRGASVPDSCTAAIVIGDDTLGELTVREEYHHDGQIQVQTYLLTRKGNKFPFPAALEKRSEGEGQFAVYAIAWKNGEYRFRLDFE